MGSIIGRRAVCSNATISVCLLSPFSPNLRKRHRLFQPTSHRASPLELVLPPVPHLSLPHSLAPSLFTPPPHKVESPLFQGSHSSDLGPEISATGPSSPSLIRSWHLVILCSDSACRHPSLALFFYGLRASLQFCLAPYSSQAALTGHLPSILFCSLCHTFCSLTLWLPHSFHCHSLYFRRGRPLSTCWPHHMRPSHPMHPTHPMYPTHPMRPMHPMHPMYPSSPMLPGPTARATGGAHRRFFLAVLFSSWRDFDNLSARAFSKEQLLPVKQSSRFACFVNCLSESRVQSASLDCGQCCEKWM